MNRAARSRGVLFSWLFPHRDGVHEAGLSFPFWGVFLQQEEVQEGVKDPPRLIIISKIIITIIISIFLFLF